MARPSLAITLSHTSSGIPFQFLIDGYKAKGARDANLEVMRALVSWEEAEDFLRDVVGYTTWSGGSVATLDRRLPLQCPLRTGLWCESYDLVECGSYEDRTQFFDPLLDNAPEQDWCIYQLNFTRPKYWVRSNDTLASSYTNKEQHRYAQRRRSYVARERRRPSFVFEETATGTVIDEVGYLPDSYIRHTVIWTQIPLNAVPETKLAAGLLTVNNAAFDLGDGKSRAAGTLLFMGIQDNVETYWGADGNPYQDLGYVFGLRDRTDAASVTTDSWNKVRRNDGSFVAIRVKGVGPPDKPPYESTDFQELFKPGT